MPDGKPLEVKQISDRPILVILTLEKIQICQVKPTETLTIAMCTQIMIDIADQFMKGGLQTKEERYTERTRQVKKLMPEKAEKPKKPEKPEKPEKT